MSVSMIDRYSALVAEGRLAPDDAQRRAVRHLQQLTDALATHRLARKGSALGWLFGRRDEKTVLRGLYVWGEVGRGKTMLMDLFFSALPVQRKRRVHFHDFMADVHDRIHNWRRAAREGADNGAEPIAPVAKAIAQESWVLCFDEFAVIDIADAMILGRLFSALFLEGVVVVATSNVAPDHLYAGGLNRALFLPFIETLKQRMDVLNLAARTDYRLEKLAGAKTFHVPNDEAARAALDAAFDGFIGPAMAAPATLSVKGRSVAIPLAGQGVARARFADLCEKPLGAQDYTAMARAFHTVIVDDIPVLNYALRNEARRFITLIDVFYEHRVKLLASAAAEPEALYPESEGNEAFAFARTVSRLTEMRSEAYFALPHGRPEPSGERDLAGIAET